MYHCLTSPRPSLLHAAITTLYTFNYPILLLVKCLWKKIEKKLPSHTHYSGGVPLPTKIHIAYQRSCDPPTRAGEGPGMRSLSQDAQGSIVLELALVPVVIKPMLPKWTLAVHWCVLMGTLLGWSAIEAVMSLNWVGSNAFGVVGLHMRPRAERALQH
jgi:hypothetical protein